MAPLCSDAVQVAPLRLCFYLLFYLLLLSLLTHITSALITYDKVTLLDIGHRYTNLFQVTLSTNSSWPLEILQNAEENNGHRRRIKKHRGKRAGIRNKLRKRAHSPPLPSILLADVQSLENKMDDLRARISFQRDIRDCNIICLSETWLTPSVPDTAVTPSENFSVLRMDRTAEAGKSKVGGVCFMINKKWCVPSFFHGFFTALSEHLDCALVIGGDLNFGLNKEMDRLSTAGTQRNWESTNIVKQYMSDYGLCDAWCSFHPNRKEYTFFSHVHHSYSRLDYFLVSSSLLSDISDTEINHIAVSDHAAVSLTLVNKKATPPSNNWRFNTSLLKDDDFIKYFKEEWALYLDYNDLPGTSASVIWEAGKAVMRGRIISFSSHKKKRENKCIQELEETIKTLEEAYVSSQEQEMLKKICKAKLELNEIINKKTKFLAQRLRWQEFEYGNKFPF